MKNNLAHRFGLTALLFVIFNYAGTAKADPVTFTLDASQSGTPGTALSFRGSVTNEGPPTVFLTGIEVDTPVSGFLFGVPFFSNLSGDPVPSLAPGETTGMVEVFNVFILPTTPPGIYSGTVFIGGGPSVESGEFIGIRDYQIVVRSSETPIPEPTTMVLLGTGLAGVVGAAKRRKNKREDAA